MTTFQIPKHLLKVADLFSSTNHTRPDICGLRVEFRPGNVVIIGCDGRSLCAIEIPNPSIIGSERPFAFEPTDLLALQGKKLSNFSKKAMEYYVFEYTEHAEVQNSILKIDCANVSINIPALWFKYPNWKTPAVCPVDAKLDAIPACLGEYFLHNISKAARLLRVKRVLFFPAAPCDGPAYNRFTGLVVVAFPDLKNDEAMRTAIYVMPIKIDTGDQCKCPTWSHTIPPQPDVKTEPVTTAQPQQSEPPCQTKP